VIGPPVRVTLHRLLARWRFGRYGTRLADALLRRAAQQPFFPVDRTATNARMIEEAVDLYRRADALDPGGHDRGFARALTVAARASYEESPESALALADDAVARYQAGAPSTADELAELAAAVCQRAVCLGQLGRNDESFSEAEAAVARYRACPGGVPAAARVEFANCLVYLAEWLSWAGRGDEAVTVGEEAVRHYQELSLVEQSRRVIGHGAAHATLAHLLRAVDRFEDAIEPAERAAELFAMVTAFYPRQLPSRASVLLGLARSYGVAERIQEGIAAAEKSAALYRKLAASAPDTYDSDFTDALLVLAELHRDLEAHSARRAALAEMVEIQRRQASAGELWARLNLVDTLPDLAVAAEADHDPEAALAALRELITVLRGLVREDLDHELTLARAIRHECLVLGRQARHNEEVAARAEALEIYERLVEVRTDCHEQFAAALREQAVACSEADRHEEAVAFRDREFAIRERLVALGDFEQEKQIAATLRWRSTDLAALGRFDEALADITAAATIHRRISTAEPEYREQLAHTLQIAVRQYASSGDPLGAATARDELRELAREVDEPVVHDLYAEACAVLPP